MKDDLEFMEKITRDLTARKSRLSDPRSVRRGQRGGSEESLIGKASMKYHPDHNRDDAEAAKRFVLVKCAYELLAEDKPCPQLLEEINTWDGVPEDGQYKLGTIHGDTFCGGVESFSVQKKEKENDRKRSSCI